mgnify:FL=1
MTIHKERHVFGSYAHGIQGSGSPADDPDHKFVDGKAEFHAQHDQGRTVIGTHEGVVIRATRALRPITAASHGGQDWCMRGCGPITKPDGAPISVGKPDPCDSEAEKKQAHGAHG